MHRSQRYLSRDKDSEEQSFRDSAKRNFVGTSKQGSFDGDEKYFVKTKTVDFESYDAYRAAEASNRKIHNELQTNVFEKLRETIKKRELTAKEEQDYVSLKNLIGDDQFLDVEEQDYFEELRSLRFTGAREKEVQKTWMELLTLQYYPNSTGDRPSDKYPVGSSLRLKGINPASSTSFRVVRADPVTLAWKHRYDPAIMKRERRKPVVICPVSHYQPGGVWEKGGDGCEELLYYRTSVAFTFEGKADRFYPLRPGAVLHTPNIMICRKGEEHRFAPIENQKLGIYRMSLITFGRGLYQELEPPSPEDKEAFRKWSADIQSEHLQALRRALRVAAFHEYDTIIYVPAETLNGKLPAKIGAQLLKNAVKECRRFSRVDVAVPAKKPPARPRGTISENQRRWFDDRSRLCSMHAGTYSAYRSLLDGETMR